MSGVKKTDNGATVEPVQEDNLAQIRDIIVGEDLRKIQAAIKDIRSQIKELKKTLNIFKDEADSFSANFQQSTSEEFQKTQKSVQTTQKNIESSMADMMKTIKAQLNKLEENKVDKSKIGQVFLEWGQKINEMQS